MKIFGACVLSILLALFLFGASGNAAHAQDPTPVPTAGQATTPPPTTAPGGLPIPGAQELDKVYAIVQMVSDLAQGKVTPNPDQLFQQSKQGATDLLSHEGAGIFFLDFADQHRRPRARSVVRNRTCLRSFRPLAASSPPRHCGQTRGLQD